MKRACMFLAFSPEQLCSDLSRQIESLLSLNWQLLKVLIVKFQASSLDQCHHLLINLSWKSASKPVHAISARSVLQLRKKSSDPPLRLRFLYCIYTLRMYTNTNAACSIEADRDFALIEALTSEVGLLQNFLAYEKWIPLSHNFWAINSRMWLINANARVSFNMFEKVWIFDNP